AGTHTHDEGVARIEAAWPPQERLRPRYVLASTLSEAEPLASVVVDPSLEKRVIGVGSVRSTTAAVKLVLRFNQGLTASAKPVEITDDTDAAYDAFYLLAYAIAALGDEPVTGPS